MIAEPRGKIKDNVAECQPGIGHNSNFAPPDEIAAELAPLEAADAETNEQNKPNLIGNLYEIRFHPGGRLTTGDLEAYDMKHAQRRLRILLGLTQLSVEPGSSRKTSLTRNSADATWPETAACCAR